MNVLLSVSPWQPAEGLSLSPFSHAHPPHSIMNSSEHHSNDTETMIIGFFIFVSPPVFVLDRIYRIYKIKTPYISHNPVNLVNPVKKPSRDGPRKHHPRIHEFVPFIGLSPLI
jgi:hypothetical protein